MVSYFRDKKFNAQKKAPNGLIKQIKGLSVNFVNNFKHN